MPATKEESSEARNTATLQQLKLAPAGIGYQHIDAACFELYALV
jgi:hypothetical protein